MSVFRWQNILLNALLLCLLLVGCASQPITPVFDSPVTASTKASIEGPDNAPADALAEPTKRPSATLAPPVPTRTPIPTNTFIPTIVFPELRGDYLGQPMPGLTPELFAPGIVSLKLNNRGIVFSPDGTELFYGIVGDGFSVILWMRQVDGVWTKPEVAPFSGEFSDQDPAISPDGQRLFFASKRPLEENKPAQQKYHLFYVDREGNGWSDPQPVGETVNQGGSLISPSVAADGTLFFTDLQSQNESGWDIFYSRLVNGEYQAPENLSSQLNLSELDSEHYPFITPDQSQIIYGSDGELWMSRKQADGTWGKPISLIFNFSLSELSWNAAISADGEVIFLTTILRPQPLLPNFPPGFDLIRDVIGDPEKIENLCKNDPLASNKFNIYWISSEALPGLED